MAFEFFTTPNKRNPKPITPIIIALINFESLNKVSVRIIKRCPKGIRNNTIKKDNIPANLYVLVVLLISQLYIIYIDSKLQRKAIVVYATITNTNDF